MTDEHTDCSGERTVRKPGFAGSWRFSWSSGPKNRVARAKARGGAEKGSKAVPGLLPLETHSIRCD